MVKRIDGFFIEVIAPIEGLIEFTTDPFPQGTNVFANISISMIDTLFEGKLPDPTFTASAFVNWWTFYQADGTESPQQDGSGFTQNAVGVGNVARINFILFVERAFAIAQINIFGF
jgi:hypothetical protein